MIPVKSPSRRTFFCCGKISNSGVTSEKKIKAGGFDFAYVSEIWKTVVRNAHEHTN